MQLFFGRLLQIQINGGDQIPSWLRRDNFNLVLNASPAVYNNFAIAVRASQVVVVDLFDTAEADDVPGLETFVFVGLLFELIGTDLADVAKHVGQHTVLWVASLRLLFNAEFGIFQIVSFDPCYVARACILLHLN